MFFKRIKEGKENEKKREEEKKGRKKER